MKNTNLSFEAGFESGISCGGCEETGGLQEPISGKVQIKSENINVSFEKYTFKF